jgi:hypothetical protein
MLCIANWGLICTSSEGFTYYLVGIDYFNIAIIVIPTAIMYAEV